MSELALIGLGSNLGDRKAHLDCAVAALSNTPGVRLRAVSSYHETAPVGGPSGQGAFLNAASALETTLNPIQVLLRLQAIEQEAGRVRDQRWGARTLDLDLLLFGDLVLDLPNLKIPHPLMSLRRFVLAPLVEIAAGAIDPLTRYSVQSLLANLDRRPSYVAIAHRWDWEVDLVEVSAGFEFLRDSPGYRLANRLVHELAGKSMFDRFAELIASHLPSQYRDVNFRLTPSDRTVLRTQALDASYWSSCVPRNRWVVSHDWFDDLAPLPSETVLGLTPSPRERALFLAVRETVLRPTFVVMTVERYERLHRLDDFLGRDTPALVVDDLDSDRTLAAVLAACEATRAG